MKRSVWEIITLVLVLFASGCSQDGGEPLQPYAKVAKPILQGEQTSQGIRLHWGWVKFDLPENKQVDPEAFYVLFSSESSQPKEVIATLGTSENTFLFENPEPGKTYYFAIRAINGTSEAAVSQTIMIQQNSTPAITPLVENQDISRSWGSWSPQGDKVAFQADLPGPITSADALQGIYIYDLNQKTETLVSIGKAPHWSPAGDKIVFYGPSASPGSLSNGPGHIHIFDRTSQTVATITQGDSSDLLPVWSPDNQWIAFLSNRLGSAVYQIWKIPAGYNSAYNPTKIVNHEVLGSFFAEIEDQYPGRPAWGPGADELTYSRPEGYLRQLFRISSSGGAEVLVLPSQWNDYSPAYSPDRQKLAFISDRTGSPTIWIMNMTDGSLRQLTDRSLTKPEPFGLEWAPDGSKILYSAKYPSGKAGLFVVETN
ncbi:MAG: hypothetical protein R3D00_07585 [Bacteroidia bacterium]